jgi:hypothetical protein
MERLPALQRKRRRTRPPMAHDFPAHYRLVMKTRSAPGWARDGTICGRCRWPRRRPDRSAPRYRESLAERGRRIGFRVRVTVSQGRTAAGVACHLRANHDQQSNPEHQRDRQQPRIHSPSPRACSLRYVARQRLSDGKEGRASAFESPLSSDCGHSVAVIVARVPEWRDQRPATLRIVPSPVATFMPSLRTVMMVPAAIPPGSGTSHCSTDKLPFILKRKR